MHAQAKSDTAASPPDLEAFLKVLASSELEWEDRINVEGVTGCGAESGGKIALAIEDGRFAEAHTRLTGEGYTLEWTTDLYHETITSNRPGALLKVVSSAKANHPGRLIDSVLFGQRTRGGRQFYVQITFEDSAWDTQPPADEFDEHDHDEE